MRAAGNSTWACMSNSRFLLMGDGGAGAASMQCTGLAKASWSSGAAFYLATVGASVGLGSIWRFPYLAGTGGGSAFIVVFALACMLIATPLLAAEFIIGRRSRASPPEAAGTLARESGLSARWNVIGVLGTIAAFTIISYYAVIAGWVMAYAWKCADGALAGLRHAEVAALWHAFLANPWILAGWHLGFVALVAVISACGVNRGLELASAIRAPVLLVLMLILAAYACRQGMYGTRSHSRSRRTLRRSHPGSSSQRSDRPSTRPEWAWP
jgi:NSS family neurotransmitter:Na+ symporter